MDGYQTIRLQKLYPAQISHPKFYGTNNAGTFVCNHVFYALMHLLASDAGLSGIRAGFMHVPWLPEQARARKSSAALSLQAMQDGLRAGLRAAILHGSAADLHLAAGTTH